jgi:hypothetical protein
MSLPPPRAAEDLPDRPGTVSGVIGVLLNAPTRLPKAGFTFLYRSGNDSDYAANGMFLPTNAHTPTQTDKYLNHIARQIGVSQMREEALRSLDEIRGAVRHGAPFPWE